VGGTVQLSFATIVPSLPFITNGQVKPMAVTSNKRSALIPNAPTFENPALLAKPSLRGADLMLGSPERLLNLVKSDKAMIEKLIKAQNIQGE
jgi:Tripartite tricarboxylate transporter family receptor